MHSVRVFRHVTLGFAGFFLSPTTHFCMGGIVVNENAETQILGLFGAGEVCAGVHGANRLGANALFEAFATGYVSESGETIKYAAWTSQHSAIGIDQDRDCISDSGEEIYSLLQQRGITNLIIMGVATNKCILHRPFGIKAMVKWGVNVILVRDMTDATYSPVWPPYVSHEEGTRLVVEYIEKFWCPSVLSEQLLA